jgi:hypothetical protein
MRSLVIVVGSAALSFLAVLGGFYFLNNLKQTPKPDPAPVIVVAPKPSASASASASITPISLIAIKDCGKLLGVLIVQSDGVIDNVPGPLDDAARAAIKGLAEAIGNPKHLVTIDMPCHLPNGEEHHEGETTASVQ